MLIRSNIQPLIAELLEFMHDVRDIQSVADLLCWDQETYMPTGAGDVRAGQISAINEIIHQRYTSVTAQSLFSRINENDAHLSDIESRLCALFLREYEKTAKIPVSLVKQLAKVKSLALEKWKRARIDSDFSVFEPLLSEIVRLKKEEATCLSINGNIYETLVQQYEPRIELKEMEAIFGRLSAGTMLLMDNALGSGIAIENDFLFGDFPVDNQMKFARYLAEKSSFDFYHGRLDRSAHPFTDAMSIKDVRITVKLNPIDFRSVWFSAMHEIGHGLYEQGIHHTYSGTLASEGASYSIHESQSLLWEKFLGQSEAFCRWALPELCMYFPRNFRGVSSKDLFAAVNKIQPSLVRIESDKLTYNLHIIIRFELEADLFTGRISAKDLPGAWSGKMRKYLGLKPPSDTLGCLQDIHWAAGSFGYFPTYTLGILQSAMLWNAVHTAIPDIDGRIAMGDFSGLRLWLKDKIHKHGKMLESDELIQSICGKPLTEQDFLEYMNNTIEQIYF